MNSTNSSLANRNEKPIRSDANDSNPENIGAPKNGNGNNSTVRNGARGNAVQKNWISLTPEEEHVFRRIVSEISDDPKARRMEKFIQHGNVTTYEHCMSVARCAFALARHHNIKIDEKLLITAAFLHDYCLYDWHDKGDHLHGFHHPYIAAENAVRDFGLSPKAADAIKSHMWPLNLRQLPNSKEAWLITTADKICAAHETVFNRKH